MKSLVVGTDLTLRGERAVERAAMLADRHGAKLTIVHVLDSDLRAEVAQRRGDEAKTAIRNHFECIGAKVTPQIFLPTGRAYVELLRGAETEAAELIVLGVHQIHPAWDLFISTTVERCVRGGERSVLIVKEPVDRRYRRVMVGVDFSPISRRALRAAMALVPDGEFHLVHAYHVPFSGFLSGQSSADAEKEQHTKELQALIDEEMSAFVSSVGDGPTLHKALRRGETYSVLHEEIDRLRPDLIALGTHSRVGVAQAVLGGVAEGLIRNPPCDLLVSPSW